MELRKRRYGLVERSWVRKGVSYAERRGCNSWSTYSSPSSVTQLVIMLTGTDDSSHSKLRISCREIASSSLRGNYQFQSVD